MLELLATHRGDRTWTPNVSELEILATWHGWGAAGQLFDRPEWEAERERVKELLGEAGWAAASRNTLNAHYTDPGVVEAMWGAVEALGLDTGRFIEPGCGRGNFLLSGPDGMRGVGVELDPTTAEVARLLAGPDHTVINGDFARVHVVRGSADVAIGNVPFANVGLYDRDFNPTRKLSMHDHFVAKAAATLRPGGLGLLITSAFTLDALSATGRRAIMNQADLVGAIRLPAGAQRAEAGTDVVTDILVLRGREPGRPTASAEAISETVELTEWQGKALSEPLRVNAYLAAHPEQVLGEVAVRSTAYGIGLNVVGTVDRLGEDVRARLGAMYLSGITPASAGSGDRLIVRLSEREVAPVGRIERTESGFRRRDTDGWVEHDPGRTDAAELGALVDLRDQVRLLVEIERDPHAAEELVEHRRSDLAAAYHRYVGRWGCLGRVTISASGRRTTPKMGGFQEDPDWPRVAALEIYDEQADSAVPAAILERRVVSVAAPPDHVDTPDDALTLSLQERGRVDLAFMASLLGTDADSVVEQLGTALFEDPEAGWVTAAEYLSGNVRHKLTVAEELLDASLVKEDAPIARNVEALRAVQPPPVTAEDLSGLLGAGWVPPEMLRDWLLGLTSSWTGDPPSFAYTTLTGQWSVSVSSALRQRFGLSHAFGGTAFNGIDVLKAGLAGRSPQVTSTIDGQRVVLADQTALAGEALDLMREHFDHWMLRDEPERTEQVLDLYNTRFNSWVPRSYAGNTIAAPDLRADFQLRPHQHEAIARMVYGGDCLLAHPVGAGKTAEMIVGAMERKRLGLIERPCFVVPNHLLDQFARDFVSLYPAADVLVIAREDISPKKRAEFAARVQSHSWDAVLITQSSFGRWALSPDAQERCLKADVDRFRQILDNAPEGGASKADMTRTKALEKRLLAAEERIRAAREHLSDNQDDHELWFDESGIDYLCVDEAHDYKNGELISQARSIRGVPVGPGSQRAKDLADKLSVLRAAHPGQAVVTLATGTPVTNTVAELWVMGRYVAPHLLTEMGMDSFDAFRAQFCDTTSAIELDVSGTSMRPIERLSRFKNLPELSRWMGEWADLITVEQMGLPRPELVEGRRQVVIVPPAPELSAFMADEAARRAEAIRDRRVEPEEDNLLKLCSDCRMAAFDWWAFRGEVVAPEHSPLVQAAERIAAIYHANADRQYRTDQGNVHPTKGAFQLVFSDLGIPRGKGEAAYTRLRDELVARGVPREKVAFVHEHDQNDEAKERFFAGCRTGRYAVAISSTPKMGQGTNVQNRMIALHHLSVPWRPSDVEQREGRILRQGNQNEAVEIIAYAAERSFATFGWQTLERKAGFIGQVLRADPEGPRSIEQADDEVLSYGEIKALATGDDDFLRLAELDERVAHLERLHRGWGRDRSSAERRASHLTGEVASTRQREKALKEFADVLPAGAIRLTLTGQTYDERAEMARAFIARSSRSNQTYRAGAVFGVEGVTNLKFTYYAWPRKGVVGTARGPWSLDADFTLAALSPTAVLGMMTRIENWVGRVPDRMAAEHTLAERQQAERDQLREQINAPAPYADELAAARRDRDHVQQILAERYAPPTNDPSEPETEAPVPEDAPKVAQPGQPISGIDLVANPAYSVPGPEVPNITRE